MSCAFTDPQLDAWVQANGPVAPGYGEFVARIRRQDYEHQQFLADLRDKLNAISAPKLYFVPGSGLMDCPF